MILHCIAWHGMDGIPGFGFECGVIERGWELLLEEKEVVDSRSKKNKTKAYAEIVVP